jgi:leader peptidase (prepilin peptidase)/N-methyltransferase
MLELTMAAALGVYAYRFGLPTAWHALDFVVLFALVSLFFFDLKHQMLPDAIVLPLGVVGVVQLWMVPGHDPLSSVYAALGLMVVFGGLYAFSRGRWLGFGDVKLAFGMGLLFGYPDAVGVTLIAVWAGALVGLGMMAVRRASLSTALPFGSFWTAAAVVTMLWPVPARLVSAVFFPVL